MADVPAPARHYTEPIYRQVAAPLTLRGMSASDAGAGCARCQARSAINTVQPLLQIGHRPEDAA